MTEPRQDYGSAIDGAIQELMAATSSLAMEPEPTGEGRFLYETDAMAGHCLEHLRAALQLLNQVKQQERIIGINNVQRIFETLIKSAEQDARTNYALSMLGKSTDNSSVYYKGYLAALETTKELLEHATKDYPVV